MLAMDQGFGMTRVKSVGRTVLLYTKEIAVTHHVLNGTRDVSPVFQKLNITTNM